MIDWTKPVKTRDGREVRIYATDAGGSYPIHGAYGTGSGWISASWNKGGSYCHCSGAGDRLDIVQLPETRDVDFWVNVYETGYISSFCLYSTKQDADANQDLSRNRFACLHVQAVVKNGEGL